MNYHKYSIADKAFTLIELLVVISIVSLLASIILTSLAGAREKGRIGGGVYFASHSAEKLGANVLGWWKLNETSGTVAHDISIHSLDLSISGGATFVPYSNELQDAASLSLDGTGIASLSGISNITQTTNNTGGVTISAWIKVMNPTGEQTILEADDLSGNLVEKMALELSGTQAPSVMGFWNNINLFNGTYTQGWGRYFPPGNVWHQVTIALGPNTSYIYIDGHVLSGPYTLQFKNSTYQIGTIKLGQGVIGNLSDVVLYDDFLTASEVRKRYIASRKRHDLSVGDIQKNNFGRLFFDGSVEIQ